MLLCLLSSSNGKEKVPLFNYDVLLTIKFLTKYASYAPFCLGGGGKYRTNTKLQQIFTKYFIFPLSNAYIWKEKFFFFLISLFPHQNDPTY